MSTITKSIKLTTDQKSNLEKVALTIRGLSIDGVQAANSGHPGLPLGCADITAYLFLHVLRFSPQNDLWQNRDRFILSAGHGSMLLYAALHLFNYDYSLQDLKDFRKIGSKTPGHPEFGDPGVETTTGPLGQGIATTIGMALAAKIKSASLTESQKQLLDHKFYALAGDGCIMEGVSSEASSLAGHLGLDNLVLIYDANDICLDGDLTECMTEDVKKRYESYGWDVMTVNGHDFDELHNAFQSIQNNQTKPALIIAKTVIGKGSPTYEGTSEVHGKPLGEDELKLTKENLGIPLEPSFYISDEVSALLENHTEKRNNDSSVWTEKYEAEKKKDSSFNIDKKLNLLTLTDVRKALDSVNITDKTATRSISGKLIQELTAAFPKILGGSADLSCSDQTYIKSSGNVTATDFNQRNIKYGPREFAMSAMASGIALYGQHILFVGRL